MDGDGDLHVSLLRTPLQITPGLLHPYDWTVRIEIVGGQILTENDIYPYWAPGTGYQPFFEISVSSNAVPWESEFRQTFYIRNNQGKYGRLFVDLSTDSKRADTGITIEMWMNPSGSQNLEFDPSKQIQ